MEAWYKKRPHTTDKNKLEGLELTLFADLPPQEIKLKSGATMYRIQLKGAKGISYKILATETDIDEMCRIVEKGKPFTFVRPEGKKWAEVGEYVEK